MYTKEDQTSDCEQRRAEANAALEGYKSSLDGCAKADARKYREIRVTEVENGFAVTIENQNENGPYYLGSAGIASVNRRRVFVAANLEQVCDILMSKGRDAA